LRAGTDRAIYIAFPNGAAAGYRSEWAVLAHSKKSVNAAMPTASPKNNLKFMDSSLLKNE